MNYRWQRIIGFLKLFPAASYQYLMYGMSFKPDFQRQAYLYQRRQETDRLIVRNQQLTEQMLNTLPAYHNYIDLQLIWSYGPIT